MISVIVPYWNAEMWIERCVESLKAQEGNFEFLFVNDNSTDKSEKFAKQCADDRFLFFPNMHTKGVSGARNTGLDWAKGQWITFLDVDDEMLPNAYWKFKTELRTPADVYQFNHLRYYTAINKLVLRYANDGGWYSIDHLPQHWFCVWNKLYSAKLVADIRFREGMQYGEDGLFNLECFNKCEGIQHADTEMTTVKHRFDNKQSLSHIKTKEDIYHQMELYEGLDVSDRLKPIVRKETEIIRQKAMEYDEG